MTDDPDTIKDALRGSSDGLLIAIRAVDARERMKRGVRPGDAEFPALAREVRVAAEALLTLARLEEAKANETAATPSAAGLPTIEQSRPPEDLADILAQWRAVERRLEAADQGSPESQRLMVEFEALRERYTRALEAHRKSP